MKAAGEPAGRLSADEFRLLRWGLGALLSMLGAATVLYMEIEAPVLMAAVLAAAGTGFERSNGRITVDPALCFGAKLQFTVPAR